MASYFRKFCKLLNMEAGEDIKWSYNPESGEVTVNEEKFTSFRDAYEFFSKDPPNITETANHETVD